MPQHTSEAGAICAVLNELDTSARDCAQVLPDREEEMPSKPETPAQKKLQPQSLNLMIQELRNS